MNRRTRLRVLLLSGLSHGLLVALFAQYLAIARPGNNEGAGTIVAGVETAARLDEPEPPTPPPPPEREVECDPAEFLEEDPEDAVAEPDLFEPVRERRTDYTFSIPSSAVAKVRRNRPAPKPVASPPPPPRRPAPVARRPAPAPRPAGPTRAAQALSSNRPPVYPSRAESLGLRGRVVLLVRLDRKGQVVDVQVTRGSGHAILDREAIRAVRAWRFRPALRRGKPCASEIEVPIRFAGF